jgi:hypothetical protein
MTAKRLRVLKQPEDRRALRRDGECSSGPKVGMALTQRDVRLLRQKPGAVLVDVSAAGRFMS